MTRRPPFDYDLIKKHAHERPASRLGFAKFLNEIDPTRSVKGWEMAILRWEKDEQKPIEGESYFYDTKNDTYYTYLHAAGEQVAIPGDTHRAMLEDYSDMIGKGLTKAQVSTKYEMPETWFKEYVTKHGWSHSSIPFTDEQLQTEDQQVLTETLLSKKRIAIIKEAEQKEIKQIKEDAHAYRLLKATLLDKMFELVPKAHDKVPKLKLKANDKRYAVVISPTDFHWGKYGWEDEVGETYNFDEARERLFTKTEELASRLPSVPEKIIVACGSDWFHVDNDFGTTTKGTRQDMCASPAEILMTGCKLAREHIDLLRQITKVQVVFMPGNHDRHSTYALMMYLSAAYEGIDDVEVIVSPKTRQYLTYGETLLGFTHGDAVRGNKLPSLMSTEARKDWGKTKWHIWFHGHLHHQSLVEKEGCTVVQLPSLAGHDRYHYRHGYTQSPAGLAAHIIDYDEGLVGSLFSPVLSE